MTSVRRDYLNLIAQLKPTVGDTKMSAVGLDHMGWLLCDGRLLNVADYKLLFNVLGYQFGGSGGQFALPSPAGRVPGVAGAGDGLTTRAIGDKTGEETHTLTINEMPAHKHGATDVTGNNNGSGVTGSTSLDLTQTSLVSNVTANNETKGLAAAGTAGVTTSITVTTVDPSITPNPHNHAIGSTGGGAAHNNMQPTIFMGNMFVYCGKTNYANGKYPYTAGIYGTPVVNNSYAANLE